MPDSNTDKLVLELVACDRCKNAFMMHKGEKLRKQKQNEEIVCENCIKLEKRKKQLATSVRESQNETQNFLKEYENRLHSTNSLDTKKLYLEKIKVESEFLTKSIELLKKIEETNDEKYIEEYKQLFERLKKKKA